jgi:hypothetical protein
VGRQPFIHVFDVTVSPPQQIRDVRLSYTNPHWVTFTINGDFAYPSGPKFGGRNTDVIATRTYGSCFRYALYYSTCHADAFFRRTATCYAFLCFAPAVTPTSS